MTEKEILLGLVSKTFNLDETGAAALIYDADGTELKSDALSLLLSKQAEAVKLAKDAAKKKFDEGYSKAKSEILSKFEEDLKEKFGLDSEKVGLELIEEIVTATEAKAGGKEVTDDDVKKHKLYLDLAASLKKVEKDAEKKWTAELDKVKSEYSAKETFDAVIKKAIAIRDSRNPIALSTDAEKAKTLRAKQDKIFLDELKQVNYRIDGEGDSARIVILKDGKVLEDEMGHAVDFTAFVNQKAEMFYDFQESQERSSASPNGQQGASGAQGTAVKIKVRKPTDYNDFAKQYEDIENNKELKADEKLKLHAELVALNKGEKAATV